MLLLIQVSIWEMLILCTGCDDVKKDDKLDDTVITGAQQNPLWWNNDGQSDEEYLDSDVEI